MATDNSAAERLGSLASEGEQVAAAVEAIIGHMDELREQGVIDAGEYDELFGLLPTPTMRPFVRRLRQLASDKRQPPSDEERLNRLLGG